MRISISSGGNLADIVLDEVDAPAGALFTDLHLGGDGRVALPYSDGVDQHGLLMVHLGRRWQRRCLFIDAPKRAWVDHLNRTWVASDTWVSLCSGEPLPQAYRPVSTRFEPQQINPNPLHNHWRQFLPVGHELLAMSTDQNRLYLLVFHSIDRSQKLFVRPLTDDRNAIFIIVNLPELPFVIDIASQGAGRLALMLAKEFDDKQLDLPSIQISEAGEVELLRVRYPQHSQMQPRFVTGKYETAVYLSESGPKELYPLPQARYEYQGMANLNRVVDSGEVDTLWHRIYFDGCIPSGCGLSIEVNAFEDFSQPGTDWQQQPKPHWQRINSELPFYQSQFASKARTQGLFEILIQRETGTVAHMCSPKPPLLSLTTF